MAKMGTKQKLLKVHQFGVKSMPQAAEAMDWGAIVASQSTVLKVSLCQKKCLMSR